MSSTEKTILEKFAKELSVLHYAMTLGASLVASLIYFFTIKEGYLNYTDTSDFFLFLCPLLALFGVYFGMIMYRKNINATSEIQGLNEKLAAYRAAKIQKFALIEGPALISVVAAMQTQNVLYLAIAGVLIVYLYTQKISEVQIVEELGLGNDLK